MAKKSSKQIEPPPARFGHAWRWTLGAVALAGIAAGLGFAYRQGRNELDAWTNSQPGIRLTLDEVVRPPMPEWLQRDVVGETLAALYPDGILLTASDIVPATGSRLEQLPWVESVRVEKGQSRLELAIEYRRPLLFVPRGGLGFYVDRDGIVLPPEEARAESLRGCMVLEGLDTRQTPTVGTPYADERVKEAAQFALALEEYRQPFQLLLLKINSFAGEAPTCELRTRYGSRIVWGKIDLADRELFEVKVGRLLNHLRAHGSLDKPDGPYQFDLSELTPSTPEEPASSNPNTAVRLSDR